MITDLKSSTTGIEFAVDGDKRRLSWTWLRDHARDPASYLASANQRLVTPTTIAAAGPGTASTDGLSVTICWPQGPTAEFDRAFLATLGDQRDATAVGPSPVAWTGDEMTRRIVRVAVDEVIDSDHGLRRTIDHLWVDGVVVIADVPTDRAATRRVLERFGYIRSTIFGDLWEFSSDGGFDDTASTPLEITPHTDGTYSHDAPGLLGLHCHVYEAIGGENVFVDAHALTERLDPTTRSILQAVEIPGQYIGDGAHLMARRPVLRCERDRLVQVSYNHHDRAPFVLPEPAMSELFAALHEFDALANDPDLQFELELRPGDMAIFDNWRVLHGRRAFRGERLLAGGYINREDVESTTRRLAVDA